MKCQISIFAFVILGASSTKASEDSLILHCPVCFTLQTPNTVFWWKTFPFLFSWFSIPISYIRINCDASLYVVNAAVPLDRYLFPFVVINPCLRSWCSFDWSCEWMHSIAQFPKLCTAVHSSQKNSRVGTCRAAAAAFELVLPFLAVDQSTHQSCQWESNSTWNPFEMQQNSVSQSRRKGKNIFRDSLSRGHVHECLSHSPRRLVVNHACNIWPARTQSVCWMWAVISLRRV